MSALTSGGKVKRNSPFSSATRININWGLPHSPINFRIKFRLPSRLPWQAFSLLGNSLWCANLGQEGVFHWVTVQLNCFEVFCEEQQMALDLNFHFWGLSF